VANVHGFVTVKFTDAAGIPASVAVNFVADSATTIGTAITDAETLATLLNGISDDAITGAEVRIFDEVSHAIVSGAETPEGVNITMETSAVNRDWAIWVPSLKDSLVVSGTINIASGAIFDFAAELVTPSGSLTWETPYENAYAALESAAKSSHKLRNLAGKKSKKSNPV
jgi:hypothetical protein